MELRLATLLSMFMIVGCGGSNNSGQASPVEPKTQVSSPKVEENAAVEEQTLLDQGEDIFRRMTLEEINGLPPVEDSICRAFATPKPRTIKQCRFIGPFQGELETGGKSALFDRLEDAMGACAADVSCMGVSSDWYTGAPWFPVGTSTAFTPDENSYGCSFVIHCE